ADPDADVVAATPIFVRPEGDDENDGSSPALAVVTLARAIELASACQPARCEVRAARGAYAGPFDLASGVHLIGGWNSDFTEVVDRSEITRAPVSEVEATMNPLIFTVRGVGLADATRLEHLVVYGADLSGLAGGASGEGGVVFTLWLRDSPGVRLEDVALHGGIARRGAD